MHMGDGGVACLPLQHIMDRFSASETLCGGNNGIVGTHFDSIKMDISQMQPMNESFISSGDAFKSEFLSSNFHGVAENGTSCIPVLQTEEVEEGEFGTLKWPMLDTLNEDNISDRLPRSDIQNKYYAPGELLSGIVDKQDPSPGPSHNVTEKRSCSGIGQREELGKIDSRLDRRHCTENGNHEAEEQTCTRYGNSHDKIYFCQTLDGSRKNTKYSSELTDKLVHDNEQSNRSKNDQETGYQNCTNHHHISKSEGGGLKDQTGDNDFRSSKIRKLHDNSGQICTDRNIRHSVERSNGHANSSRISSHDKYSSRHRDSLSSRANHNSHGPRFPDRSPRNRTRHHDRWNRSPIRRDNSPYNRGFRNSNRRTRSPHMEKSPMSRVLHRDRSEYTPSFSPYNSSRQNGFDGRRNSLSGSKGQDEKQRQKDSRSKGKDDIFKQHDLSFKPLNIDYCCKKRSHGIGGTTICSDLEKNKNDLSPRTKCGVPLQSCKYLEDQQPMEEDMDICVTPPHLSSASESTSGKWFYLDHHGMECGPLKLHHLKKFVKDGVLVSDHLVKHLDSDRWATIENAASPSLTLTASSAVSYSTTHIVSPPEAPGNLLLDVEDVVPPDSQKDTESGACCAAQSINNDDPTSETSEDLHIDERVEALVRHFSFLPGMELEILAEALGTNFDDTNFEKVWGHAEGFILNSTYTGGRLKQQVGDVFQHAENSIKDDHEGGLTSYPDRYLPQDYGEIAESFNCLWPCKGGDWVRNDAFMVDKCSRKKVVLNHGFPLCKMPVCLSDDPRWLCKDEIYLQSHKKLQLPPWAFCCPDEPNDLDLPRKSAQLKPSPIKGLKGSPLQLIRINACVVKDCENSTKEMNVSKSERSSSCGLSDDLPRESIKFLPFSSFSNEQDLINIARDHIHTIDELQLHLGDWYYFDGIGQERGPFTFSFLHGLVDEGVIQNGSSVYRKYDKIWVPIGSVKWTSVVTIEKNSDEESGELFGISSRAVGYSSSNHDDSLSSLRDDSSSNQDCSPSSLLHSMHPQFLGFTRGKLHELVMKSYRSREFAAAINEVLDPWINAKQPTKEMEKHIISPALVQKSQKTDLDSDGEAMIFVGENVNGEEDPAFCKGDSTFDDLCSGTTFKESNTYSGISMDSWGLLDGVVLARIFHSLRNEARSLIFASLTCKHWKSAVQFYKEMCREIDLSSLGPHCSDGMIWTLLSDYNRDKVTSIVLVGCTSLSPNVMEKILCSFRCLLSLDIRGCNQLADLSIRFPDIYWIKHRKLYGPANSKLRNPDRELDSALSSFQKNCRNFPTDDFSELKDYFDSVDKRDAAKHLFRKNLYKRSKLFDARKSSSIVSRDARIRRWAIGKHENGYKRMEEFLTLSLKGIMRVNTFDFFKLKVAEIEERIKNGFYARRGLTYVMEDISRMCKEAMRERNHTSMNSTIASLMELVSCLEKRIVREHGMHYKKKTMKRRQSEQNRRLRGAGSETSEDHYDFSDCGSVGSDRDASIAELKKQEVAIVGGGREWGARMTEASLVPPVTRKYEFIEGYVIVVDEEDVRRKMSVSLPDDHAEKMSVIEQELDMEIPEVKEYRPRKKLGDEVIEQEVYGIDPYTHNLLLDSMPDEPDWPLYEKHLFIEDILLRTLNTQAMRFTGAGPPPPMTHSLRHVVGEIQRAASSDGNLRVSNMCVSLIDSMARRSDDEYVAYRKGLGVVCNRADGFAEDDFVVEFLGEVYPAWKWFEKQDGIRSLQKDNSDPAPEFYNIYLERPKGDANGYDLVVVDAMHKANYASRICHSCHPNCEAKVTAVNGHYQIGIYTLHPIQHGEEITFDYNSVTESKEEYEASVCLCGSRVCRGSYLNLTGEGAFLKVLEQSHGLLDRVRLMVEACDARSVPEDDYIDLGKAGLGSCLLGGLPDWLIVYSARLVRFINFERMKLPEEILHHNVAEKRKFFVDVNLDVEKSDAELQAEGVYNQRLQNLAVTLDKVRYVMRRVFGDAKLAPPPLQRLSGDDVSCHLSNVERSLLDCITPHVEPSLLSRLTPPRSLLWLRDELRNLPCTYKCRHDAAADLIQLYAHTQSFYRVLEYAEITSPAVYISPLDLGPNHGATIGQEYRKTYGPNYCLGQLMFWYNQTSTFPDVNLVESGRGCLFLPEMGSFYARPDKPSRHLVYGPRTLRSVLTRMEKAWPEDGIWTFDSTKARVMGSPALDAAINHSVIDRNMVQWLRTRSTVFQTSWDK